MKNFMDKIKDFFDIRKKGMRLVSFNVIVVIALLGCLFSVALALASFLPLQPVPILIAAILIASFPFYLANYRGKLVLASNVMVVAVCFILFPAVFFVRGGIESGMSSAINAKIAKYLGRETVIGDALTLPWDIAKDANIDKYGIQGARDRVLVNIYGTIGLSWLTLKTRGYIGAIIGGSGAVFLNEYKEVIAPLLNDGERKKSDEQYVEDLKDEMD